MGAVKSWHTLSKAGHIITACPCPLNSLYQQAPSHDSARAHLRAERLRAPPPQSDSVHSDWLSVRVVGAVSWAQQWFSDPMPTLRAGYRCFWLRLPWQAGLAVTCVTQWPWLCLSLFLPPLKIPCLKTPPQQAARYSEVMVVRIALKQTRKLTNSLTAENICQRLE